MTAERITDRHPALADDGTAWTHLAGRVWSQGSLHQNLTVYLNSALRVWGANTMAQHDPRGQAVSEADDVDTVAALAVVHHQVRECVDQLEAALIEQARDRGITWEELAPALAVADRRGALNYHRRLLGRAPTNRL